MIPSVGWVLSGIEQSYWSRSMWQGRRVIQDGGSKRDDGGCIMWYTSTGENVVYVSSEPEPPQASASAF